MLAVRISKILETRLENLARNHERSKSYYVKKALEKFLDEEEEKAIAAKAYESQLVVCCLRNVTALLFCRNCFPKSFMTTT